MGLTRDLEQHVKTVALLLTRRGSFLSLELTDSRHELVAAVL